MNDEGPILLDRTAPPTSAPMDPWTELRAFTAARIALGRSGGSVRSETLLDFRLSHAGARDAVLAPFRPAAVVAEVAKGGLDAVVLASAAKDRRTFLLRPDLGRRLSDDSRQVLAHAREIWGRRDAAIIVSDGLSAFAAERHAVPTIRVLAEVLVSAGWTLCPIIVVPFGRVKLQDEIGEILGLRHAVMLLGERPGLGSPDSLGAYFTYGPQSDRSDADRNCVSNIRPDGLAPRIAGRKLAQLMLESARLGLSGVNLKDPGTDLPPPAADPAVLEGRGDTG